MTADYGSIQSKVDLIEAELEDRELLMENGPGYGTRSKIESAFNLVNSTVGSGIIGLPFAVYLAGFWNALLLSVLVAAISQFGLYMFIVSAQRTGAYRLATLMEKVIGRPGYHFLNFLVLVQATGACVSYYILMGDTIPVLLQIYFPTYPNLTSRSFVLACIALLFVLPLNLSRSLGALAKWSILSVLCLPVIIIALLIRAPAYAQSHDSPLEWHSPDIFGALGILAFAFSCPHVCFSVYLSQKQQSVQSWNQTTTLASILTWIVSISFALVGYLSFGVDVHPNLFLNFPADDALVNVARFALGFSMILTIPMAFHPTREAVHKLLGFETAEKQATKWQHYSVTLVLFVVITFLGINVRSLGKVYSLIGGFAASCLAYILPALAYLLTRKLPNLFELDNNQDDEIAAVKTPLITHQSSSSTLSHTSDTHPIPKLGLIDAAALFTLVWGTIILIFSTASAFK